jgi:hypothetical protein
MIEFTRDELKELSHLVEHHVGWHSPELDSAAAKIKQQSEKRTQYLTGIRLITKAESADEALEDVMRRLNGVLSDWFNEDCRQTGFPNGTLLHYEFDGHYKRRRALGYAQDVLDELLMK